MRIMVFKTNVLTEEDKSAVEALFEGRKAIGEWSVDLNDRDRVLRIETDRLDKQDVIDLLQKSGYKCEELL